MATLGNSLSSPPDARLRVPAPAPAVEEPSERIGARRWGVLGVLCIAVLVVNIDSTILNVALPTLVRKLHATSSDLQWIVDAYAMVFAGLLLVSGSVADHVGRKRTFLAGFVVFAIGSLGAAFSNSVDSLIAGRAVMGVGGALLIPASLSILNDVFEDPRQRAKAVGLWSGTIGVGLAIGPVAGGLLLSRFAWGSVFFVNVPIVIIGAVAAWRLVPESKNPAADQPDPGGAMFSIVGLGLVLWAIIEAPIRGWTSASVAAVGLAGIAALVIFVRWEAHSDHPMLKLSFFRSRRFSAANASLALAMFGLFGALFVLTQVLQSDLGFSPLQAGIRILPTAGVLAATAPLSTRIVRAIGSKLTATTGLVAVAAGLWIVSAASTPSISYTAILPGMLLLGLGAGLLMPTAADAVLGSLPRAEAGVGSATYSVSIQVGGALGVAVIGSMLSTRYQHRIIGALASHHLPAAAVHTITGSLGGALGVASAVGGETGSLLAHTARSAFISGSHVSLAVGAVVASAAAVLVLATLPSRASVDSNLAEDPEAPGSVRSDDGIDPVPSPKVAVPGTAVAPPRPIATSAQLRPIDG